jgi:hypothetical protein
LSEYCRHSQEELLTLFHTLDALLVVEPGRGDWFPPPHTVFLAGQLSGRIDRLCELTTYQPSPVIWVGGGDPLSLFKGLGPRAAICLRQGVERANSNAFYQVRALLGVEAARRPGLRVGVVGGVREFEVALAANTVIRAACDAILVETAHPAADKQRLNRRLVNGEFDPADLN